MITCSSIPLPCWAGDKLQNRTRCCRELSCLELQLVVICGCLHKDTLPTDLCTLICWWESLDGAISHHMSSLLSLWLIFLLLCLHPLWDSTTPRVVISFGHFLWNLLQWAARLDYWLGQLQMGYNQASKSKGLIPHTVGLFWYFSDGHFRVTSLTTWMRTRMLSLL